MLTLRSAGRAVRGLALKQARPSPRHGAITFHVRAEVPVALVVGLCRAGSQPAHCNLPM